MQFSKKDIIIKSWRLMSKHLLLLTTMVVFIFSLIILFTVVQDKLMIELTYQSIIFIIASSLFNQGISLGIVCVSLNIINSNEIKFSLLFAGFHMLLQYVLASLLYLLFLLLAAIPGICLLFISIYKNSSSSPTNILSMLAILLIIVPTVYLSIRLQFFNYFLIDQECGILDSIKNSAIISRGKVLELFVFGAYLSLIVLISLIPLSIGLAIGSSLAALLAIPVGLSFIFTVIALGYVYTILKSNIKPL
tara:strand:+ start:6179 stop:6925 length:747 start_codon:yes stop_codon:yes gene_type:complete